MPKEPTREEREEQQAQERRAESNSLAQHAAPLTAGDELAEGSDARKAKLKEAQKGQKREDTHA